MKDSWLECSRKGAMCKYIEALFSSSKKKEVEIEKECEKCRKEVLVASISPRKQVVPIDTETEFKITTNPSDKYDQVKVIVNGAKVLNIDKSTGKIKVKFDSVSANDTDFKTVEAKIGTSSAVSKTAVYKMKYLKDESDLFGVWDLIIDEAPKERFGVFESNIKLDDYATRLKPEIQDKAKKKIKACKVKDIKGKKKFKVTWDGKDDASKKAAIDKYKIAMKDQKVKPEVTVAESEETKIVRIGVDQIKFEDGIPLKFYATLKSGATYTDVNDDIPDIQWKIKNLDNTAGDAPHKEPKLSSEKLSTDADNYSYPVCYVKGKKIKFKARLAGKGYEKGDKIRITLKETDKFDGSSHTEVAKGNEPTFTAKDKNKLPDKISKLENYVLDFLFEYDHKGKWKKIGVQKNKNHTFYTTLDKPVEPWGDGSGPSKVKPWVSVLDKLCRDWAKDKTDKDDTAGELVEKIFHSGFKYHTSAGASFYTSGAGRSYADLKQWTNRLNGFPSAHHKGGEVNCTDCATMVTSLSNILGCELWSSRFGYSFRCHKIISIGFGGWEYPFPNPAKTMGRFSYHEIGWKGSCDTADDIFDPCLKVASDPVASPATSDIYPRKMAYSVYELKLVWPSSVASVTPKTSTKIRRKVR